MSALVPSSNAPNGSLDMASLLLVGCYVALGVSEYDDAPAAQ